MSKERAEALLTIMHHLNNCVVDLDGLQVGDVAGRISPIKHRLRDALFPIVEELRTVAREEYLAEEKPAPPKIEGIEAHKPGGGAVFFYLNDSEE